MAECWILKKKRSVTDMSNPLSLSILIPVYNYDVGPLVRALSEQCSRKAVSFEIRIYDDASDLDKKKVNKKYATLPGVVYKELEQNIGRSRIRNLLAREAAYEELLFLDCDCKIPSKNFIEIYLLNNTSDVVIGGTIYAPDKPKEKIYSLHWKAGKFREERSANERVDHPYHRVTLNNIMILRDTFMHVMLDESIVSYGHEDTKFGQQLEEKRIPIRHIDNPVIHKGLNTNIEYLEKTKEAQDNLYRLYSKQGYGAETGVVKAYKRLEKFKLKRGFILFYRLIQPIIENNLNSGTPSLFFFDLFKLYHFIKEEREG